jgi:hypothetical protein
MINLVKKVGWVAEQWEREKKQKKGQAQMRTQGM